MTSVKQVVISAFAEDLINAVAREQADLAAARTAAVGQRLQRVLEALAAERVGTQHFCLLYTSPSPRDKRQSRMPSSA